MVVLYLMAAVALYILPGWALVTYLWKGPKLSFWEKLGISAGVSIAIYPLIFLWLHVFGLRAGPWFPWVLGAGAVLALFWKYRGELKYSQEQTNQSGEHEHGNRLLNVLILVTVGLIVFTRLYVIRDMVAPAWGDSVHHTFIVQLVLDNGGLFDSWAPYAPIESLTYHFGFHTATAVWAWLTGVDAIQSTLIAGQILNVLAVLALFPLVTRLSGSRWAGLAALIVAGFIFPFPGYYVNWGRYTQLTAQIILPAVVFLFDIIWTEEKKPKGGIYVLIAILLAGVALTHYRVAFIGAAAAVSWAVWGIWKQRRKPSEWIGRALRFCGTGLSSFLIILPWILHAKASRMLSVFSQAKGFPENQDFWVWRRTDFYFSDWFLILGGLALLLVFIGRRRLALPVAGWCLVSFFMTNPFLLGLPGSHWIENPILLYGIYIPLGIVLGWGIGLMMERTVRKHGGLILSVLLIFLSLGWGLRTQLKIVDPFFQMMMPSDKAAFAWIKSHVPEDAKFIVNGFQVPGGSQVVGSDAGWWLPLCTLRASLLPPALYRVEALDPSFDQESMTRLAHDIRSTEGELARLRSVLCQYGITHVYLGEKRGSVGYGAIELISEDWLRGNPDFTLLYQNGKAQVWKLNTRIKGLKD